MNVSLPDDARDYNIRIWNDSSDDHHDKTYWGTISSSYVRKPAENDANKERISSTNLE
jgi:hypothetical protein